MLPHEKTDKKEKKDRIHNMLTTAIVKRRLKEGVTYEEFRKAWYHTVGFDTPTKMVTTLNAFDPREVIVIGFVELDKNATMETLRIDIKERLDNPLDHLIEPEIDRTFGVVVAEDDFSPKGSLEYQPAKVGGEEVDLVQLEQEMIEFKQAMMQAAQEREQAHKEKNS